MMKIKNALLIFFLISLSIQSQNTITGTLTPNSDEFTWVAIYQLKGAKQLFIKNETITNGNFSIEIPETASKGMYRLRYKMDNKGFVDFIYEKEDIQLKFDPENPSQTVIFLTSEENKIYSNYLKKSSVLKQKLDSLQYSFFNLKSEIEKNTARKTYQKTVKEFREIQFQNEQKTQGKIANNFIKAGNKYYSETLITAPQEYLNSEKTHYFDFIDFSDTVLVNSTFITQSVINYVFYLNVSEDIDMQTALYKNAVNELMSKIGDSVNLKSEIITTLLYSFSQIENVELIDYLLDNFYNKLPENFKNKADIKTILDKVKLAVGKMAPDFSWEENGQSKTLYNLNKSETYVLVFWSTGCSHCLKEIPKLYEYSKDKTNFHVVAFAIENDSTQFNIFAAKYKNWTNVLGLKKWQNEVARNYEINSTPTYFILDSSKKIIAKPLSLEDVEAFFGD